MGRMRDLASLSKHNLQAASKSLVLATGGSSMPLFMATVPTIEGVGQTYVFFMLYVDGSAPLRILNVSLARQAGCGFNDSNPRPAGTTYSATTSGLKGELSYHQTFESFRGGYDQRAFTQIYPLSGTRTVFWGSAVALNGSWQYLIRLRRGVSGWQWRSTVYHEGNSTIRIFKDDATPSFPMTIRNNRILPLTNDDCDGPIDK